MKQFTIAIRFQGFWMIPMTVGKEYGSILRVAEKLDSSAAGKRRYLRSITGNKINKILGMFFFEMQFDYTYHDVKLEYNETIAKRF
jgi:hypothetical protein